jgi:hypothetical protein
LATEPRTANHDNFSLARLIFHLLFTGRNPLEPVPGSDPEVNTDRVFGYSQFSRIRPDDYAAVLLADLTPLVAGYFERALAPPVAGAADRPTAAQWTDALGRMLQELRPCGRIPAHFYVRGGGRTCPWCRIAAAPNGVDPFRASAPAKPAPPPPPPPPPKPSPSTPPAPPRQPARPIKTAPAPQPGRSNPLAAVAAAAGFVIAGVYVWNHIPHSPPVMGSNVPSFVAPTGNTGLTRALSGLLSPQTPQQRAADFAIRFQASFADPGAANIVERYYAHTPTILYRRKGEALKPWPRQTVVGDALYQINRWPNRKYVPRLESVSAECNPAGTSCSVTLDTDYEVSAPDRTTNQSKSGTWTAMLGLDMTGPTPLIARIEGHEKL